MLEIEVKGLKAKVARCTTAIDGYRVVYSNLNASFKALQKAETAYFAINSHQPPNSEERVKYASKQPTWGKGQNHQSISGIRVGLKL